MNSELLYEYLTKDRSVSRGQKKLIRNAANYAAGLPGAEEQAAFLSAMLDGVYSGDNRPEITAEKISCAQKKKKSVRACRRLTRSMPGVYPVILQRDLPTTSTIRRRYAVTTVRSTRQRSVKAVSANGTRRRTWSKASGSLTRWSTWDRSVLSLEGAAAGTSISVSWTARRYTRQSHTES